MDEHPATPTEVTATARPSYQYRTDDEQVVRRYGHRVRLRRTARGLFALEACEFVAYGDDEDEEGVWRHVVLLHDAPAAVRMMATMSQLAGARSVCLRANGRYLVTYTSEEDVARALESIV